MRLEIHRAIITAARDRTANDLSQTIANALLRPGVVLARIWVAEGEDLRLAGSAGAPTGGGTYSRLDGQFGRIRSGVGKIGHILETRTPLVVRSIRGDEEWLANPGWIARQGVRAFLGYPLIASDEVVGVLAMFDRSAFSDATMVEVQFLADYTAARLLDLRERVALGARVSALNDQRPATALETPSTTIEPGAHGLATRADLRALEKRTIEAALARTSGRVFGPRGAALLLGMKPTTLASRIKALGIR